MWRATRRKLSFTFVTVYEAKSHPWGEGSPGSGGPPALTPSLGLRPPAPQSPSPSGPCPLSPRLLAPYPEVPSPQRPWPRGPQPCSTPPPAATSSPSLAACLATQEPWPPQLFSHNRGNHRPGLPPPSQLGHTATASWLTSVCACWLTLCHSPGPLLQPRK